MKTLALLIAVLPSVALAAPHGMPMGHSVTLKNATIQSLEARGTINIPAGKDLVVTHPEWGAVSNSAISSVQVISGKATVTTKQLTSPPPGAIGWGGSVKNVIKGEGLGSYEVKFTNGMGQSAIVKVNTTLMGAEAPAAAK